jgi:hypothetical protein
MSKSVNEWIQHTKTKSAETKTSYKESLQDHGNAFSYFGKKAETVQSWKTPYQQDLCVQMYSLHAVNQANGKDTAAYAANDHNLKNKRSFVKKSFE